MGLTALLAAALLTFLLRHEQGRGCGSGGGSEEQPPGAEKSERDTVQPPYFRRLRASGRLRQGRSPDKPCSPAPERLPGDHRLTGVFLRHFPVFPLRHVPRSADDAPRHRPRPAATADSREPTPMAGFSFPASHGVRRQRPAASGSVRDSRALLARWPQEGNVPPRQGLRRRLAR